jgi:hypothetical protein
VKLAKPMMLPILVSANPRDAGATDLYCGQQSLTVRVLSATEIMKKLQPILLGKKQDKSGDVSLILAVAGLKHAYEEKDEMAFKRHFGTVAKRLDRDLPKLVRTEWSPPTAANDMRWNTALRYLYEALLNVLIHDAHLVTWYSDKTGRFLPGVFCSDWIMAVFVNVLANQLRLCPKCTAPFIPKDSKDRYCNPAHGVSYRQARSRWRKGQKARTGGK